MNWKLLAALALCVAQAGRGVAAAPVRVAIVPPTFDSVYPEMRRYSETLADYLQGKLRDTPGVEWVERGDLDKLLDELKPAVDNGVDISPMVLGRLLKADVVLCGHLDDEKRSRQNGVWEFSSEYELQVIDLTNASVLARERSKHPDEVAGVSLPFDFQAMDPDKVAALVPQMHTLGPEPDPDLQKLQAMGTDKIAAEVRKVQAADLGNAAAVARKLLLAGLAERRAMAAATQLVPIFFANTGTGQNPGDGEKQWQETLREEVAARPDVRLLQFLGIEQARQEQKLALLGLTQADPSAWQGTADGYVWGGYQTVAGTQTVDADEAEVEAEMFLRLGGDEPVRFARRCQTRDFPDAIRALTREALDAARGKHPRRSSESGVKAARMIYERLCGLVRGGFFQADPPLADTLPPSNYNDLYGGAVRDAIKRLPQAEQKMAYCRQMLDLACFFDPSDNRMQMLRWTLANPGFQTAGDPDRQLEPMVECVELLERIAHARGALDVGAFVVGADAAMDWLVPWQRGVGWTVDDGEWATKTVYPAHLDAQHKTLLGIFLSLLVEKLPEISRRLDEAKVPLPQRRFLDHWMSTILSSHLRPEFRLQYLAAARSLTPSEGDLSAGYQRLMDDLGDRKRVQDVLMKSEPLKASPTPRPDQPAPAAPPPPPTPPAHAPGKNLAAVLVDWKPVELPPVRSVAPSLEPFSLVVHRPGFVPFGRAPDGRLVMTDDPGPGHGISVRRIDGSGDQIVLGLAAGGAVERRAGVIAHLLFQTSSQAVRLLGATTSGLVCSDDAHVLYRQGEFTGWTDLLTGRSGVFSPGKGSPVATPAAIGFDGTGRAVVAGGAARTVALFDWNKGAWLIVPPPPAVPPVPPVPDPRLVPPSPAEAFGVGDAIVFPLWNLVFDQAKQQWRNLPGDACLPRVDLPTDVADIRRPIQGGRFCVDGHLWSWNEGGITEFSVGENRVVWHADAPQLRDVCQDGPYLWIALGEEAAVGRQESTLALFDRKRHTVLGTVALHFPVTALHADDRQLWIGSEAMGWRGRVPLRCVNKAKLYAALPGVVCPGTPAPRRATPGDKDAALYAALLGNDPETTRQLLDHGTSANTVFGEGRTPALMVAAWTGSETLGRLLLGHGAKPDALLPNDHETWTALAAAARQGDRAMLQTLLEAGAKPTEAALAEAVRNEDFEASAALIKAGAPLGKLVAVVSERPNEEFAGRILDLHLPLPPADAARLAVLAKTNGDPLPDLGGDPEAIAKVIARTPVNRAARIVRHVPAARLRSAGMKNSLVSMIWRGSVTGVNAFLDAGFSLSADSSKELLDAALGQPDIFLLLLRRGADPHGSDAQESTLAERVAGAKDAAAMLPALLEHYPDLGTRHGYGTFGGSLLCAVATGSVSRPSLRSGDIPPALVTRTLQTLLDRGISPDARGREGFTALHGAFAARSAPVACWLAGTGVDLHAPDLAGRTVFDASYGTVGAREGFVEKLRAYAPKSDQEAKGRQRLLDEIATRGSYADLFDAVNRQDLAGVREMLQKGWPVLPPFAAWPEPEDKISRTSGLVFLAVKNGQREMVRLLLEHGCEASIGEAGCDFYASNTSSVIGTVQPFMAVRRPEPRGKCPTPLIVASAAGDLATVDLLLDHGAYVPATDQFLRNAVDAAATPGLGAHIGQRARAQFAAEKMVVALEFGLGSVMDERTVQRIMAETPEALLTPDGTGESPLSRAVAQVGLPLQWTEGPMMGSMDSTAIKRLGLLHQHGVRLDSLDAYGTTPLHRAVLYGRALDAAELIKIGFDPRLPDRRGITPVGLLEGILDPKRRQDVLAALSGPRE